ncbi:threonine transporter RhtB [Acinetobacter baumannii]|nr:threonine transporter RhtB [Acinetobacter baumannii]
MLIGKVSATLPLLPPILKLLSACYIIFLAIKLWHTANQQFELDQPTIRPRFPVAAWTNFHIYLIHMLAYLALITPIALFWIFLGSVLAANKVRWLNQSNLQRTASLVLVSFSIPISYSALLNL